MTISYIIPVYNTSKDKLKRCFNSIVHSSKYEYEVIIIDDGSDSFETKTFCKDYCEKKKHFKYYYYQNCGVSIARNRGIKISKGDYIYFVDSDDEIINCNLDLSIYSMADIILTNLFVKENTKTRVHGIEKKKTLTKYEYTKGLLNDNYLFGPCAKYIKRKFIIENSIFFREDMINGEDLVFNFELLKSNPVIINIPYVTYCYWKNESTWKKRIKNNPNRIIDDYIIMQQVIFNMIIIYECSYKEKAKIIKETSDLFIRHMLESMIYITKLPEKIRENALSYLDNELLNIQYLNFYNKFSYWQKISLKIILLRNINLAYIILKIMKIIKIIRKRLKI